MQYDLIVIGAGPAGITAAIYAMRKGLSTLVVSKDIGGQAMVSGEIENYLGFSMISGPELVKHFKDHLEHFPEIRHADNTEIRSITKENNNFNLEDTNENHYTSRTVIIATGRKPRWLDIPGEREFKGRGVSSCATCDGPLFRDKEVVVIGGGNSGLEAAELLTKFAKKVYIINITESLTGDQLLQKKVTANGQVEIINNTTSKKIVGEKKVTGLVIENNKTGSSKILPVQGIFVEIGYEPSVTFDQISEKDEQGAIKVNPDLETSVEGLYAAGDVNDLWGEQIIIAAGEGAKAAMQVADYLTKQ